MPSTTTATSSSAGRSLRSRWCPAAPTPDPVQSVALSGDGRYLAWLGLDDMVHRYDFVADRTDLSFAATKDSYIAGVSADGVLVASRSGVSLRDAAGGVAVPVRGDLDGWASDVAGDLVVVNDALDRSSLYDVSDGTARPTETFPGSAALGPYAERVAVIVPEARDRARVEVWDGGTLAPVTGLDDVVPTAVRWADETTLLVTGGSGLYACHIDLRCGRLPVDGVARHRRVSQLPSTQSTMTCRCSGEIAPPRTTVLETCSCSKSPSSGSPPPPPPTRGRGRRSSRSRWSGRWRGSRPRSGRSSRAAPAASVQARMASACAIRGSSVAGSESPLDSGSSSPQPVRVRASSSAAGRVLRRCMAED